MFTTKGSYKKAFVVTLLGAAHSSYGFLTPTGSNTRFTSCSRSASMDEVSDTEPIEKQPDRRQALQQGLGLLVGAATITSTPTPSYAKMTGPNDGNLPDLPMEAVRSYLQYRAPLQTSTDYYLFDLYDLLDDPSEWGAIGDLFSSKPTRIEREYTNVMRIVGLSMPPDEAEAMRDAQYDFEKAMAVLSKVTLGIRRDLPVELDPKIVPDVKAAWDDGRIALNKFLTILNGVTGLDEMKTIPPPGPNQLAEYGRSQRRYLDLKKKIRLCQNRGGPTLSNTWGALMVSGYMQDSCGIPDLEDYFYQ